MRLRRQPAAAVPFIGAAGNLVVTAEGLWAVFRLGHRQYDLLAPAEQRSLLEDTRLAWADLAGARVHLRVSSTPFPHAAWAEALDRSTRRRLLDQPGGETWADYLASSQEAILADSLRIPVVMIAVRVHPGDLDHDVAAAVYHSRFNLAENIAGLRREYDRISNVVARPGFNGRPATGKEIAWLTHVSLAPGIPAPSVGLDTAGFTREDRWEFTSPVTIDGVPYAPAARVTACRGGRTVTRWVTTLTLGRVERRCPTALLPWAAYAASLEFPVELTATLDVIPGDEITRRARDAKEQAVDQREHYLEHGQEPPADLDRVIDDARRMEDQTSSGTPEVATRIVGPVRVAIPGHTPEVTAARVESFIATSARNQRLAWVHTRAQAALLPEFVPCAPISVPGMTQVMEPLFVACAGPNTLPQPGTPSGPLLGATITGTPQAVLFDPTWGPRHNRSGLAVITGGLGSGKSTLQGVLAETAARCGHRVVVFDPSGGQVELARLPHLAPVTRVINLAEARRGTLNPYTLVPLPHVDDYPPDSDAYKLARAATAAERRTLMSDAITMLMPPQLMEGSDGGRFVEAIRAAVDAAPSEAHSSPWGVVHELRKLGQVGHRVAGILETASRQTGGLLVFPDQDEAPYVNPDTALASDAALTIITTPGITPPPPGSPRAHWTWDEQVAAMVTHLAARATTRAMYADRHPKMVVVDELGLVGGAASVRAFVERVGRDSRKWQTLVAIASQNPADLTGLATQLPNLVGCAWIGRMESMDAATAGLELARVPAGIGHETSLLRLEPGQFLLRGWTATSLMQVYVAHRPELAAALNTTPTSSPDAEAFKVEEVLA